jgi:hypothetical protein
MPTVYQYLNTTGPMAEIFQGLMSNDPQVHLTPDAAQRLLATAVNDPNSPLSGQDMQFLTGILNKGMNEINDYQAASAKNRAEASSNDPFTKMGLPAMGSKWDASTVPTDKYSAGLQSQSSDLGRQIDSVAKLFGLAKNADGSWDTSIGAKHVQPNKGKLKIDFDASQFTSAAKGRAMGMTKQAQQSLTKAYQDSLKQAGVGPSEIVDQNALYKVRDIFMKKIANNGFLRGMAGGNLEAKMNDAFQTSDASNIHAYDYIDVPQEKRVQKVRDLMNQQDIIAAGQYGRNKANADWMNAHGQTPSQKGLADRIAMMRQFGIGL